MTASDTTDHKAHLFCWVLVNHSVLIMAWEMTQQHSFYHALFIVWEGEGISHTVMSNSLWPQWMSPTRLLYSFSRQEHRFVVFSPKLFLKKTLLRKKEFWAKILIYQIQIFLYSRRVVFRLDPSEGRDFSENKTILSHHAAGEERK